MRHLIFSDLQAHNYQEFSTHNEKGINSRLLDCIKVLERIGVSVVKNDVEDVWFLGDLFQKKNNVDSKVLRLVMEKLYEIAEGSTPIYILPGNHDYRSWTSDPTLLELASDLIGADIYVCDGRKIGKNMYTEPFTRKVGDLEKRLEKLDTRADMDIFLGHQYLKGTKFGSYEVTYDGIASELLFKKFRISFLGHCHMMFRIKDKKDDTRIVSIGAPLQHTFGDAGSKRGWWIFDDKDCSLKYVKNSFSPKFHTLMIEESWNIEKAYENNEEMDFEKDFFRIKVLGSKLPGGIGKIKWKRVMFEVVDKSKKRSTISFSDKKEDIFEKYIHEKKGTLNEKKLLKMGRDFL